MKYFTVDELCRSSTATARGIDNRPPDEAVGKLKTLIEELLDPIRAAWGAPVTVNSGYRSPALNAAVGGVATSQHLRGEAADLSVGNPAANERFFRRIEELQRAGTIEFDQLIDEARYRWVHISYRRGANRGQVLHL
ncbi:D-Ala-D-Ala carboxypeptidase family metallohydrolase [uncultured Rikenella sp.]|uniref:D-Ala-D-Ala carboxypeptidase family metallohydrolase n=1 Tax=uncultured Rikenella sp. TaxID=368003 RepID=UPI0025DA8934|nr:D-Ala-D-Ala carboxypeptidase family metallohydrolase [uncultured Rikenella sp.]